MPKTLFLDLRMRMLAAMLSSLSYQQAEIRFGVSASGNAKPKAVGRDRRLMRVNRCASSQFGAGR
jgi:hypothetical protein